MLLLFLFENNGRGEDFVVFLSFHPEELIMFFRFIEAYKDQSLVEAAIPLLCDHFVD